MSSRKHRKALLAKGAHPAELDQWAEIDPAIANLLLSAGVSLDTYRDFKDRGLTEYRHFNDAIIRGLTVREIVDNDEAARRREWQVEKAAKEELAHRLRSVDSWDDEPDGESEHWYFTPERIREYQQNPPLDPDDLLRNPLGWRVGFVAGVAGMIGWIITDGPILLLIGSVIALVAGAVGMGDVFFHNDEIAYEYLYTRAPRLMERNSVASVRYPFGYEAAIPAERADDVRHTWDKVIAPAIDAGAHPCNMDRWLGLSTDVRENALAQRVGVRTAEKVQEHLRGRIVTPLAFIEAVEVVSQPGYRTETERAWDSAPDQQDPSTGLTALEAGVKRVFDKFAELRG